MTKSVNSLGSYNDLNIFNQITHFQNAWKNGEKRKRKTIGKSTNNTWIFSYFFLSNL